MKTRTKGASGLIVTFTGITVFLGLHDPRSWLLGGMGIVGMLLMWVMCVLAEREDRQPARRRIFLPLVLLWPAVASAIIPAVIGLGLLGGGAIWLGLKLWSKIESIQIKNNAKPANIENRLVAVATVLPPAPTAPASESAPDFALAAAPSEPSIRLGIHPAGPGVIEVEIPGRCDVHWSRDGGEWWYLGYYPEATNEAFDTTLEPMLFFRAHAVRP